MKTHMLFGDDGVNSFENIPILLGKITAGMALLIKTNVSTPTIFLGAFEVSKGQTLLTRSEVSTKNDELWVSFASLRLCV